MTKRPILVKRLLAVALCAFAAIAAASAASGQTTQAAKAAAGSEIAKAGFRNEDEIRDKFNNWRSDEDAKRWLAAMNYDLSKIETVAAGKPHGEKADVEVRIRTRSGEKIEGISIKLVSSPNGFNQIDKRWLSTYAKKWKMPADVVSALKYFVGEIAPIKTQAGRLRSGDRMYLNELEPAQRDAVVAFFTANKDEIVSDLIAGDGTHAAGWMLVALKVTEKPRWVIRSSSDAAKFFGEGRVELTRTGNLKIGRITMQRKGGDGGRETAKMLQFKINPVQLFDAK
jgi:hypothetical protein